MRTAKRCHLPWLAVMIGVVFFQSACVMEVNYLNELRHINASMLTLGENVRLLQEDQGRLKDEVSDGLAVALCRPEVRQLLEDVTQECVPVASSQPAAHSTSATEPRAAATPERAPAAPSGVGETCDTKKIEPAVIGADPEHRGRLLRLMISLRHEVFYMRPNASELISFRRDKLNRLANQRLLMNTRFIIIAFYDRKDAGYRSQAIRRAELVRDKLRLYNNNIDQDRIQLWLYSEAFRPSEIVDRVDLPQAGEPQDFARSVWIFRADC